MPKNVKLLLTENVEALGIVGDVVSVRTGYARNFLLPRSLATTPSDEKVKALASKRADAERMLAELRKHREALTAKLQNIEVSLIRSCNDMGILYGAITQQDIAGALKEKGYDVRPRDVRLNQVIKRVDSYDVHLKLDSDLDATVKLTVAADRKLDQERARAHEEPAADATAPAEAGTDGEAPADADRPTKKGDKPAKSDKPAAPAEKTPAKPAEKAGEKHADKGEKKSKGKKDSGGKDSKAYDVKAAAKDTKGTFARPAAEPEFDMGFRKPRRGKGD